MKIPDVLRTARLCWIKLGLFGVVGCAAAGCSSAAPSDEVLLRRFEAEQATFEALREFACKQPHETLIFGKHTNPALSASQVADLKAKLATVKATGIRRHGPACVVSITVWTRNVNTKGLETKGYRFGDSPDLAAVPTESLDDADAGGRRQVHLEREIGQGWRLVYDRWPN